MTTWIKKIPHALLSSDFIPSESAAKLRWILKLRWVALSLQFFATIPGVTFGYLSPDKLPHFFAILSLMTLLNFWAGHFHQGSKIPEKILFTHLAADLLCLLGLLLLSGGRDNPLITLLLLHAALGPLILSGPWNLAYFLSLLLTLGVLFLAPSPTRGEPLSIHFISLAIVAMAIWQLTSWLSRTLQAFHKSVRQLEKHENRMDYLRSTGALASGFCHEFATPLNTIKIKIERLTRNLEGERSVHEDLAVLQGAVLQCESSLKNLMEARLENQSPQLLPLTEVAGRICEGWSREHPMTNLKFHSETDKAFCQAPPLALSQTLLNLLDNAHEASSSSPIEVKISTNKKWTELRVRDQGPGFPKVVREKIGEPFVTTKPQGTGLGLFNAVRLLTALGGRFEIENLPSGGAEARLLFQNPEAAP